MVNGSETIGFSDNVGVPAAEPCLNEGPKVTTGNRSCREDSARVENAGGQDCCGQTENVGVLDSPIPVLLGPVIRRVPVDEMFSQKFVSKPNRHSLLYEFDDGFLLEFRVPLSNTGVKQNNLV